MSKQELYNSFDQRIRAFEESLQRLVISASLAYDKKHHMALTQEYAAILSDLKKSELEEADKGTMSTLVVELLEEAKIDLKYIN